MTPAVIANIRLHNQQITNTKFKTPEQIVSWMGALQAQDYAMSKWAVGIRLPHSSQAVVEKAIDSGKIIRTHVLRPTWHLVSCDDIYWMLELTSPHIKVQARSQEKKLEITEKIYAKSNMIIEKALRENQSLTRKELMVELNKSKIDTSDIRALYFTFRAELDAIICNGIPKKNQQTYSLLSERVARNAKPLTREEAAAKLAKTYFESHGPATLKDFCWWSGLPVKDANTALENIKHDLIHETAGAEKYWLTDSYQEMKADRNSVYLLPAFDEFIISYKNRDAAIPPENQGRAFTTNGLFKPLIVKNGKVKGLWKRTLKKDSVLIETEFFQGYSKTPVSPLKKAMMRYSEFVDRRLFGLT